MRASSRAGSCASGMLSGPGVRSSLLSAASHGAPPESAPDPSIRLAILASVRPAWPSLDIPRSFAPRRHRPSRSKFSRPHSAGTRATSARSRRRSVGEPHGPVGAGLPSGSNAASGASVFQSNRLNSLWKCGKSCGKTSAKGSWSCSGPSPLLLDVGLVPSGVLFSYEARGTRPWCPSRQRPDGPGDQARNPRVRKAGMAFPRHPEVVGPSTALTISVKILSATFSGNALLRAQDRADDPSENP